MRATERGFSMVEASVATALVAGTLMMAARWVVDGAQVSARSGTASVAAVLAAHKLEQLRALRWTVDTLGVRRADLAADTAVDPPTAGGGLGLSVSPPGTLDADVPGYVDFVTAAARPVSTRVGAAYVRRWAITPLAFAPDDAVLIDVCVAPASSHAASEAVCTAGVRTRGTR
ncbi:MAG: hypothetical protein Q8L86_02690 [Vicinamibacterales bacterium]|nr:hypothetical protein [Vicinamibacterales bacterium]